MSPTTILVTVASAGTPQRVSTDTSICATAIYFWAEAGNTNGTQIGTSSALNKSTFANMIVELEKGTGLLISDPVANGLHPADYWVDADSTNNRLIVTYWVI